MKRLISPVIWLVLFQYPDAYQSPKTLLHPSRTSGNLVIITIDGLRWQEIFTGADSLIIHDEKYTHDPETMLALYWENDQGNRRKKLMPFFWNVIAAKGRLYGNRYLGNKVNVANPYAISYPGYSEMLTGTADYRITSNRKRNNPNINVLEYLDNLKEFRGKVAVFTSWDVFPYILGMDRNQLHVNSGYEPPGEIKTRGQQILHTLQSEMIADQTSTRDDQLTYISAKEYMELHHPRVVFVGLGETDESAHSGRYDLYLSQAAQADRMIGELWHWVQTTEGYKNNTTFIITTDHGRGNNRSNWTRHGTLISGSSQTWIAVMGPGIAGVGEIRDTQQQFETQIAGTIAALLGKEFNHSRMVSTDYLGQLND